MSMRRVLVVLMAATLGGCGSVAAPPAAPSPSEAVASARPERPLPQPVVAPPEFRVAIGADTRSREGVPGRDYWQQWADYRISARVDVESKTLSGSETIRYRNNSPDRLPVLVVNLLQNYHAEGVERVRPAEVTGGMTMDRVAVGGRALNRATDQSTPGWAVEGTLMFIVLPEPLEPNSSLDLAFDWSFRLPREGMSGRMGYSGDELLYLGYWYPQIATFDDVIGWHAEPFRGNAEFYSDFGSYRVTVDAPEGWLVMSTGELENPAEVLAPDVVERLRAAESSDDVVHVVSHAGARSATRRAEDGRLRWTFAADSVRDVAFAVMKNHAWDAARTPVGDRDGDGETDYTRVDAFWREHARNYDQAWRYAQHSIDFLSRYTGLPYAWPHMSVVEGGGIIGGGWSSP